MERTKKHAMILLLLFLVGTQAFSQDSPINSTTITGYHEFNYGQVEDNVEQWTQAIRVSEPELRSEVRGDVQVRFQAPGMTQATALCWRQTEPSNPWGEDVNLTPDGIALSAEGTGSFVFSAEQFPHGPVNVRIYTHNDDDKKDILELQLFNQGGVVGNQGIPDHDPPATEGLQLIFADDFDGLQSISNDGLDATYMAHKPGGGDFSGWPFSNILTPTRPFAAERPLMSAPSLSAASASKNLGDGKPFDQQETWLRIAARKDEESPNGRTGIIGSVNRDFEGIWAQAPCYLECRFTAQSAIGTWPAFWTLALGDEGTDELDIVEAYGGKGVGNPNHPGYSIVSHFWNQQNQDGTKKEDFHTRVPIMELGGKSYWSSTFHTYGLYIGREETVYYFDDIEVLRHPTNDISIRYPHFFMVNYAIGGISGWPTDLERYDNGSDMWVDYVRIYAEEQVIEDYTPDLGPIPRIDTAVIGLNFSVIGEESTELSPNQAAGVGYAAQRNWNNLSGANGEKSDCVDDQGVETTGTTVSWSVPGGDQNWRSKVGRDWGFKRANLTLQTGYIQLGGRLSVTDVPYDQYDVYVYLGADGDQGSGSVTISSPSGETDVLTSPLPRNGSEPLLTSTDPNVTYFYWKRWLDGLFVPSDAVSLEEAEPSNCVVFRENTAKDFHIDWTGNLKDGWTGVSGVQIIERP